MVSRLLPLLLLGGAGLLLIQQGRTATTDTGGRWWSGIDLGLPAFGDSLDWAFTGNTNTTGGDMSQPRGIRNNNPGNIEHGNDNWQGMDDPPSDGRFIRFTSPEYGIRALARVLTTYERKHGLNYIGGIIQRWAPAHENNSAAYAGFVAKRLGVRATDPIDVQARMPELIAAIIEYENGQQPYALATINKGVSMA